MKFVIVISCILLISLTSSVNSEKVRYDNYKVYKVKFTTEEQFEYLFNMKVNTNDVDFWQLSRSQKYADIMVGPQKRSDFLHDIQEYGMTYEVMIDDVQKTIDNQNN